MSDTTFDTQQWTWRRAYESDDYGGLPNTVYVSSKAMDTDILVAIPTEFLTFFTQMHPLVDISSIELICELCEGRWLFGYLFEDASYVDLWSYKKLPPWLDPNKESVPE